MSFVKKFLKKSFAFVLLKKHDSESKHITHSSLLCYLKHAIFQQEQFKEN